MLTHRVELICLHPLASILLLPKRTLARSHFPRRLTASAPQSCSSSRPRQFSRVSTSHVHRLSRFLEKVDLFRLGEVCQGFLRGTKAAPQHLLHRSTRSAGAFFAVHLHVKTLCTRGTSRTDPYFAKRPAGCPCLPSGPEPRHHEKQAVSLEEGSP